MGISTQTQITPFFSHSPEISERIKYLKPYEPVTSREKIKQHPHITHYKLDWNESTIVPSPRVVEAIIAFLETGSFLNWYPDMFYTPLYERLSDYTGREISELLVTNGSDAALELICQTYLNSNDNVVFPQPTYNHFVQFAQVTGAELRSVECRMPYQPTLREIERFIDNQTKILYLVNPNNPTGNVYSPVDVLQVAARYPHVLVISDEAYFEFSGVTCAKLVAEVPNLCVTRTFSKAFSLASMRIGYLIAPPPVIENLRRVHNPKSVNMLGQVAACAALDDLSYCRAYVREVKRSASLVEHFCTQRKIPCRTTYANWVLMKFDDAPGMACKLAKIGVHVRDRSRELPGILRMSLGTEKQTAQALSKIEQVLDEKTRQENHSVLSNTPHLLRQNQRIQFSS